MRYFSNEKRDRLHPSTEGHRRIAETMATWLLSVPTDFKNCAPLK